MYVFIYVHEGMYEEAVRALAALPSNLPDDIMHAAIRTKAAIEVRAEHPQVHTCIHTYIRTYVLACRYRICINISCVFTQRNNEYIQYIQCMHTTTCMHYVTITVQAAVAALKAYTYTKLS